MDLITLDFETYYSKEFSLGKLTTEEYIRDPRFEVIGVSVKLNNQGTEWASGTREELTTYLKTFPWDNSLVVAHNTMFDGAILSWIFDIHPKVYGDTLCMARAYHGVESSGSLKALAERHKIGEKGTEVIDALGKKRLDFNEEELERYGDYCINDVDLTYKLFNIMGKGFPKKEFKLIDATLRMFVEPILELAQDMLEQHLTETRASKDELLTASGVSKEELMSNPKFAEVLKSLGVEPPMKISLTTGKEAFAFAKSDEGFKALESHPDEKVQALVMARLGTKSTLEETRTQRFIDIAKRGLLPVPVKYYARVLAWLAEQDDLTKAFTDGEDVYVKMASRIYDKAEEDVTKDERFVGKTTILGAGYGMGALKFQSQLKTFGSDMPIDEARRVISIYREANWKINNLWRDAQQILVSLSNKELPMRLGRGKVLVTVPEKNAIRLPSGLLMRYEDLDYEQGEKGIEFSYQTRRGRTRIYGGKVVENVCQAIARCIIGEQMLEINKKHRAVLTVHDSIVCCVKDEEVTDAQKYIEECMRWTPEWADGLPINCESGTGKTYGDCE